MRSFFAPTTGLDILLQRGSGNIPPTPTPTTPLSTFTERGITWNFSTEVPVGQYISGDYFALAGVVTSTSPVSAQMDGSYDDGQSYTGRWVHGLMVDPGRDGGTGANPQTTPQGFDSLQKSPLVASVTELAYDHTKNLDPGATSASISGVKSLVKTFSVLATPDADSRRKTQNVSLLTLVDTIPPNGSFRRWAGATSKTPIFFASDVDWTALPSIAKPTSATTLVAADLIAKLGPLQTYMNQQLYTRGIAPRGVQNPYGADIANDVTQAMLFCMTTGTSEADRNAVGYRLIQAGLDIYDATEAGRRWSSATFSFGGAHQWLKILMVFAGVMLRNAANTAEIAKLRDWCDGTAHAIFAEDMCTFSITREMIESTPYEPINTRLSPAGYPDWSENSIDWLAKPSNLSSSGLAYELAYRTINGYPWLSQALVVRLLGAEAMWNNPKFFEYCDTFYDKWTLRAQPTDNYFFPYNRFMVQDYYTTYSPAYNDASAPTLVRRAARSRFAWMEFNENFALTSAYQPTAADVAVTVDGSAVSLTSVSTTASGVQSNGSTNMQFPVITVASAAGIKIGQRVVCANLRPDTFVASISGTTIGITSTIALGFSAKPVTFENVFVYNRMLVAVLPTPLTSDAQPVTIGYTAPGSGFIRNLAGVGVATLSADAATNYTGQLPAGPVAKELAYSGADAGSRQYSGGPTLRSETIKRLRMSLRFMPQAALAASENLLASSTASTTSFRVYAATTSALRIFLGGTANQDIRAPSTLSGAMVGKLVTLHFLFDGTQTTQTAAKKLAMVWDGGGSSAVDVSTSTGTLDGSWNANITSIFFQGLFAFASGSGGNPFHGSIKEITVGWGDETLPLPADFSGAGFAHDADWGPNGAGPWGQNQLYFAGPVEEWNAGIPNRGNYGAYSLVPRNYVVAGDPDSGIDPLYVSAF